MKTIIHVKQRAQCGGEIPGVDGVETDGGNNTTGESPAGKVAKEKDGEYRGRKSQRHAHLFLDGRDSSLQFFDILLCGQILTRYLDPPRWRAREDMCCFETSMLPTPKQSPS